MAHSWQVIDRHKQLRLGFVSSDELKWQGSVEKVCTVFLNSLVVELDSVTSKWVRLTALDAELTRVLVVSWEMDSPLDSILSVPPIPTSSLSVLSFNLVVEISASSHDVFVDPVV